LLQQKKKVKWPSLPSLAHFSRPSRPLLPPLFPPFSPRQPSPPRGPRERQPSSPTVPAPLPAARLAQLARATPCQPSSTPRATLAQLARATPRSAQASRQRAQPAPAAQQVCVARTQRVERPSPPLLVGAARQDAGNTVFLPQNGSAQFSRPRRLQN
jgi:hypothetical protein